MSRRCWPSAASTSVTRQSVVGRLKFGRLFAQNLRRSRPKPTGRWHLDEMAVKIRGKRMWLWRAVDDEGEVLDVLVQKRRNTKAALRLLRKLLKNQGIHPETFTTDKLASYGAAFRKLGCRERHRPGRMLPSNRAENSHLVIRRRERKQQKFKSQSSAQTISFHPRRRLQHLQHASPRDPPIDLRLFRVEADRTWAAATVGALEIVPYPLYRGPSELSCQFRAG